MRNANVHEVLTKYCIFILTPHFSPLFLSFLPLICIFEHMFLFTVHVHNCTLLTGLLGLCTAVHSTVVVRWSCQQPAASNPVSVQLFANQFDYNSFFVIVSDCDCRPWYTHSEVIVWTKINIVNTECMLFDWTCDSAVLRRARDCCRAALLCSAVSPHYTRPPVTGQFRGGREVVSSDLETGRE